MELHKQSLVQLLSLINEKKVSSKEVFEHFLAKAKKYNPTLNAFVTLVDSHKTKKGLLNGLPLAVKDNFCTRGVKTTASSKVLEDFIPPYESTVTQKLTDAGYSLLGKTNMDAWAHGSSTETSDFGPTKNPWDISRAPGGSSGGSACSVAAGLAPAAIGSETAGSIRQPAAWSGIVGLKPTYGRVSRYGVIAMGSSFDCPGPMTTTVEDSALLLEVIAGKDPLDATSLPNNVTQYQKKLNTKHRFTLGVPKEYMANLENNLRERIQISLEVFRKLGHTIKEISLLDPVYSSSVYTILQRSEVSSNLARYTGIRYGKDRSYFGDEAKRRIMFGTYALSQSHYDALYVKAQKVKTLIIQDLQRAFDEVDLIVAPTTPVTALTLGEFKNYAFFGEVMDRLNEAAAVAGTPAINIPCGLDKLNLPVGLQIMGNFLDEERILQLAYQFEQETEYFGVIKQIREKYT